MKVVSHAKRLPRVMAKRHNSKWGTQPPKAVPRKYAFWMRMITLGPFSLSVPRPTFQVLDHRWKLSLRWHKIGELTIVGRCDCAVDPGLGPEYVLEALVVNKQTLSRVEQLVH
jgi:hypothetical protein